MPPTRQPQTESFLPAVRFPPYQFFMYRIYNAEALNGKGIVDNLSKEMWQIAAVHEIKKSSGLLQSAALDIQDLSGFF